MVYDLVCKLAPYEVLCSSMLPDWVHSRNKSGRCPGHYIDMGGGSVHDPSLCRAPYCKCARMLKVIVARMEECIRCAGPANFEFMRDIVSDFTCGPRKW